MNKIEHLNKALHNESFFNSLDIDTTKFKDWVVTGIFYSINHYYQAYFAVSDKHAFTHKKLDKWIKIDKNIGNTYIDYRALKQYRWEASYKSRDFSPQQIKTTILPKFENIKKQIPLA